MPTKVSRGGSIVQGLAGTSAYKGIAVITSGTTVVSVAAVDARSGAVILTGVINFSTIQSSGQAITTGVQSVGTGSFLIVTAGSVAPAAAMPVGWFIVR